MGKGTDLFMQNPYWKEIYDNAPSEELKKYYRISFDFFSFSEVDKEQQKHAKGELEKIFLSKEDVKYLMSAAGSNIAKMYYHNALKVLSAENGKTGVPASMLIGEIRNPYYNSGKK